MARQRLERPVFLKCFSRGGSNIFWNLFLSHPHACSPIHETLAIFRADWRRPTRAGLWLALLSGQPRFFDQWNLRQRRPLNSRAARYLDRTLQRHTRKTLTDPEMRYKTENEVYTADELASCRLVAKHNNGLAFATDALLGVYPDATFFGLVRHPVALYESHRRRGITSGPRAFARFYSAVSGTMQADAGRLPCYHLVRFEDMLREPVETARSVQRLAGFDDSLCPKLRFKAKAHYRRDGSYGSDLEQGRHHWLAPEEVPGVFEPSINRIQKDQLSGEEIDVVMSETTEARGFFGYD